jgi:hypothetical protein
MPTQKPRVPLILPDETREVFLAFAKSQGKPLSVTIVELLVDLTPQIRDLTKLSLQVKAGKAAAARRTLTHMVGDAAAGLMTGNQPELFRKGKAK